MLASDGLFLFDVQRNNYDLQLNISYDKQLFIMTFGNK